MRKLKPSMEEFLTTYNNVTLPNLLASGYVPNAINKREALAATTRIWTTSAPTPVAQILDDTIDGGKEYDVPVRIFHPDPEKELPVMIYFHGGGGLAGSVTVYDPILRNLAVKTGHIVVAPEYSLAPERPYPMAEIDARTVYYGTFPLLEKRGVKHNGTLCFGGDSFGGALTAALARDIQHDEKPFLSGMFLIYPGLDFTMSFPSIQEEINGKGYLLEISNLEWYYNQYFVHGENRYDASPIFNEMTSRMPRALIITAEFCPLRDEGKAYADRLSEIGVETEYLNIENMPHTFMNMEDLAKEECQRVYAAIHDFLHKNG